ncbi:MAG: hypothetical protein K9M49_06020 [Candidatus Marinimicrobia bacterium]|nr:hypothetical protein [Candidatus Neomarinimicrobiota bacterium]MCF7904691.1 hypothetical protein [Candidatus Neomarinimicrobiota bacterium]
MQYDLAGNSSVDIMIYDMTGKQLHGEHHIERYAGHYKFDWAPTPQIYTGVYFIRISITPTDETDLNKSSITEVIKVLYLK